MRCNVKDCWPVSFIPVWMFLIGTHHKDKNMPKKYCMEIICFLCNSVIHTIGPVINENFTVALWQRIHPLITLDLDFPGQTQPSSDLPDCLQCLPYQHGSLQCLVIFQDGHAVERDPILVIRKQYVQCDAPAVSLLNPQRGLSEMLPAIVRPTGEVYAVPRILF